MLELSRKEIESYLKVYSITIINWQKKGLLTPIKSKNIITYNLIEVITLAKKITKKKEFQLLKANKVLQKLLTMSATKRNIPAKRNNIHEAAAIKRKQAIAIVETFVHVKPVKYLLK